MEDRKKLVWRIVWKSLLAFSVYFLCWVSMFIVRYRSPTPWNYSPWFLYYRLIPGIAEVTVAILLCCKGRTRWWLSLLIATSLWMICARFGANIAHSIPDYNGGLSFGYSLGSIMMRFNRTIFVFGIIYLFQRYILVPFQVRIQTFFPNRIW